MEAYISLLIQAIFIESSYVDERRDNELFSHLTPAWVIRAFDQLASMVDAFPSRVRILPSKKFVSPMKSATNRVRGRS